MTERLDRIAAILLQNTSQIATLLEGQIKFQSQLSELTQDVDGLRQGLDEFRQSTDRAMPELGQRAQGNLPH